MTQPLEIKVDLEANASYVRYRRLLPGEHVAETLDVFSDGAVAADLDGRGNVLGIEILGFNPETIYYAQTFAQKHDLAFPRDIAGASQDVAAKSVERV